MGRPLRIEAADMWYHVMDRGNARKEVFLCAADYQKFLDILADSCEKFNVEIHSYVLMPNHFHFFLKTKEANLSRFMHQQLTSYSPWFNKKYEHVGHLYQGRYKAIIVDNNQYGTEVTRYIHLNPVRTKKNLKRSLREKRRILNNYKWSSYSAIIGLKNPQPFLYIDETLERFGIDYEEQIKSYIDFVEEGIKKNLDSPLKNAVAQTVLGSEFFIREICKTLIPGKKFDVPNEHTNIITRKLSSLPIERIFEVVCDEYNIDRDKLIKRGGGRGGNEARKVTFYLTSKYCVGKMNLREIGRFMGCKDGSSVTIAVKRLKEAKNKKVSEKLKRIERKLYVN